MVSHDVVMLWGVKLVWKCVFAAADHFYISVILNRQHGSFLDSLRFDATARRIIQN